MLLRKPMKSLFLLVLTICCFSADATNYYVANSGNDSNNGTDPSTPWKTIDKVNSFTGFVPGDQILFRRGDTFYGGITVSNSGSVGNPITFGAYGSGNKPVITGFTTVSSWTNLGGNIWESSNSVSTLSTLKMVVVNGVNTPVGRYPNGDLSYPFLPNFLYFQSHTGSGSGYTSITSSNLTSTTNWTGADVVVRVNHWTLDKERITSQSGNTLNYVGQSQGIVDNWGFFIQNDPRTLDVQNEWYYNPSTHKIRIYSSASPSNVLVTTVDTLFKGISQKYIRVDNLNFTGANTTAICLRDGNGATILNCNISYTGENGLDLNEQDYVSTADVENNTLEYCGSSAIFTSGGSKMLIKNNIIRGSGIISVITPNDYSNGALYVYTQNSLVQYNTVDSSAYCGIQFRKAGVQIRNNFVNHSTMVRDDGGGIYTGFANEPGKVIDGNIVLNSVGNIKGVPVKGAPFLANGIYIDDLGNNITVRNNTVANCPAAGLFMHNNKSVNVHNNTFYNNGSAQFPGGGIFVQTNSGAPYSSYVRDNYVTKNILFAKVQNQWALFYDAGDATNTVQTFGVLDSNYYAKPLESKTAVKSYTPATSYNYFDIAQWQTFSGKDLKTNPAPTTITDVNDLRFEYNPTSVNKTVSLDASYIDVKGNSYNGSISLAPYSSVILIRNGAIVNASPTSDAGKDQAINLPTNNVKLSGSGSDSDGTIASYRWREISGGSAVISDSTSASTTVNGLIQGIYTFELTVTDDKGATGKDTVQIKVNSASNIPPTANAGKDQTITLPATSVNLSGSGSDQDGSISKYKWTKISGPSSYKITDSTSASTSVNELVQGIYTFELTVTDDKGATGKDTVQIKVNALANMAPIANAGKDQAINLPTNNVKLSGSGTDSDGSIASYKWRKVSGGSAVISDSTSVSTTVNGLIQGIYTFELTVTDDKGATGKDTVQVKVNASANIAPIANAGKDQAINLPTNNVKLSGSGTDSDGSIASYKWRKVSGGSAVISDSTSASTTVNGLVQGIYTFELTVTDDKGATGKDTVQVKVNASANIAPIANAGKDQAINLPTNNVKLSGSGSDSDGTIASYKWREILGGSAVISDSTSASTTVNGLIQGIYTFELTVTDDKGATGKDTVQIKVNSASNIPPTANAGKDQTIALPANSVNLSGTGTDSDGSISKYLWRKVSGPSSYKITDSTSGSTTVNGLIQGIYTFELTVTDDKGAMGKDTVQVKVNAEPSTTTSGNKAPAANAGEDQTITLPVNSVQLSGSGSDVDGKITAYAWTKVSGPSTFSLINSSSAIATVSNLLEGVYKFQIEVTDDKGASARDTMQVKVNAPTTTSVNKAPTANAGEDHSITLPVNSVQLSGSGSDADGTIVSYSWTKVAGPASYSFGNSSSAVTKVSDLAQGVYKFQMEVTDDKGARGKDTVQITVNASAANTTTTGSINKPPTANAGSDITVISPTNSVDLVGNGIDSDGEIKSYTWTQISGASLSTIENPNSSVTHVTNLSAGTYEFELKVTDDQGAIGTDTVNVTVALPRTAPLTTKLNIYPNPVHSVTTLEVTAPAENTNVAIIITDMSGTAVYKKQFISGSVHISEKIDMSNLIKGVYVVSVYFDGIAMQSMKVIRL